MLELLEYKFMLNAVIAAVLTSISCGIIGTYVVSKRIVFISGGITHASFGGLGIGYYMGINPLISAGVFSVMSALGIEYFGAGKKINEDSLIGIIWAFGMAVGIIFVHMTPGYAPDLMTYLFGNILTVSDSELYMMGAITAVISITFFLLNKEIINISFDETYMKVKRVPVKTIKALLMCLVALTIVINIRVVGTILVISLLTIPQASASIISSKFNSIIFSSIGFAMMSAFTGLYVSYELNIPSGASIIFLSITIFIIVKLLSILKSKSVSKPV